MKRALFTMILWIVFSGLNAQTPIRTDKLPAIRPSISAAYLTGGEITTKTFYFNSGYGFYTSFLTDRDARLSGGLGCGFERLRTENFIPFYGEITGKLSEKNGGGTLQLQAGYALASNTKYEQYDGYEFQGGPMFAAGWGYYWPFGNGQLGLSVLFRKQYATLEFTGVSGNNLTDKISYSMLNFRTSFDF